LWLRKVGNASLYFFFFAPKQIAPLFLARCDLHSLLRLVQKQEHKWRRPAGEGLPNEGAWRDVGGVKEA